MTEDKRLLLDDICQEYFQITPRIAQRKGSLGLLPVPAFRLSGTRKGPWYVHQSDLDAHIQRQYEKAIPESIRLRMAKEKAEPKPQQVTCLYRHFDSSGTLLYVGISTRVLTRIAQHRTSSHWSDQITRIDVDRHPSWSEAYAAETEAIRKEKPLHNKAKVLKASAS